MSRSSFKKSVVVLAGGTAGAQLITVAALPLLTRLYSPADFELLAIYLAGLGILSAIACLRFEIAIPIPEEDGEGFQLLAASLSSVMLVSTVTCIVIHLWSEGISNLLNVQRFERYLWLLPIGTLMTGVYASFQYWSNRQKRFGQVSRSRIAQAGAGVGVQIGAGTAGQAPGGLLLGHMLYGGAGALGLAVMVFRRDSLLIRHLNLRGVWGRVVEYRSFPIYSTFEAFSNAAAIQLPVLLIAAYAIGPEAGFVLLATRVMGAPMQLIGSAISQVYIVHAPEAWREGRLQSFTYSILKPLAIVGVPGMIIIAILAPSVFVFAFGEEWRRAGVLVQWMTPWFIFQFLSAPVAMALHVTGRQRTAMLLQVYGLVLRAGGVVAVGIWSTTFVSEAYAVSGAVFYATYLLVVFRVAGNAKKDG